FDKCGKRTRTEEEIAQVIADENKRKEDEEFILVQNKVKQPVRNENNMHGRNNRMQRLRKVKPAMIKAKKFEEKFLRGLRDDDLHELNVLKDKILVDKYLNLKLQPSLNETKNWTQDICWSLGIYLWSIG
ncbi:hypothetical protein Tco_0787547, partial [Tanacetum coccineum]